MARQAFLHQISGFYPYDLRRAGKTDDSRHACCGIDISSNKWGTAGLKTDGYFYKLLFNK
jgi:hypothetical protein